MFIVWIKVVQNVQIQRVASSATALTWLEHIYLRTVKRAKTTMSAIYRYSN